MCHPFVAVKRRLNFFNIAAICFLLNVIAPSQSALAADIWFTSVPPYGTYGNLIGEVSGVTPSSYRVLVYIYVSGWWNKPSWAQPQTVIAGDRTWSCNVTGAGASDTTATKLIAFLIPYGSYNSSWQMAGNATLPAVLYTYPYAEVLRTPTSRAITFSGHNFSVKTGFNGPGPNEFSDSTDNVWVDASGNLHLKIAKRNGIWYCSEIIADESPGYGMYVFTVETRLDQLDDNMILGLFTWHTAAPQYNYREIDFEFGTWGTPGNNVGQFVIQPWDNPGNTHRFDISYPATTTTTHVLLWRPDWLRFQSYYGNFTFAPDPTDMIRTWYYTGADTPPAGGENIRMNFWLIWGNAPVVDADKEVVISDFQYLPILTDHIGDIDGDLDEDMTDWGLFVNEWLRTDCREVNVWCNQADINANGTVDLKDVAHFAGNLLL